MLQFLKAWLRLPTTWVPLAIAAFVVLSSLALSTTCHTRRPAELSRRQQRRVEARRDSALTLARRDSLTARRYQAASDRARLVATRYQDSAIYYATHAHAIHTALADSSSLPGFWADFFAR